MMLAVLLACIALAAGQSYVAIPGIPAEDRSGNGRGRGMPPALIPRPPNTPFDEYITSSSECADYGVPYCTRCENPGVRCYDCAWGNVLNIDYSGCSPCDQSNCMRCRWTSTAEEATECLNCYSGYYMLEDSSCALCGDFCTDCTADTCLTCISDRFVYSKVDVKNCIYCGSTCTSCSVDDADAITCTSCITGYYLSDGRCLACQTLCDTCTKPLNDRLCSNCRGLSQISDDTTKCLSCGTGCTACSGESANDGNRAACTTCVDNYYLDGDQCTPCMSNCINCDVSGSCIECREGYYKADESGSQCLECSWRCKDCEDSLSCTECYSGYTSKLAVDVTCDRCPSNCLSCTVTDAILGRCTTCATGYYLLGSTRTCRPCSSNCLSCIDDTNCRAGSCETGYLRSNDDLACHFCPENCATGSCTYNETMDVTHCTACDSGYTINDELTVCIACQEGCQSGNCDYNSTFSVTECICASGTGTPDITVNAQQFRGGCTTSTGTYACKVGYYYDEAGDGNSGVPTCTACGIAGCDHCNSTGTIECLDCTSSRYETTPDSGICTACGSNCLTCNSNGDCTSCVTGYGVLSGECRVCGSLCNGCSWSGTGSTATSRCTSCRTRTIRDTSNTANCLACDTACSSCTVGAEAGTTLCSVCQSRYELDSASVCQPCPDNCDDCEFQDGSLVCISGECDNFYGRKSDKLCYECPNNCPSCAISGVEGEDVLICTACSQRYTINSRLCTPCPSNCPTCTVSNGNVEGASSSSFYYLDQTAKTCQRCVANCRTCTSSSCSECVSGYGLSADRKSCVPCATLTYVDNCAYCTSASTNENSTCTDCISSHVLSDNFKLCTARQPLITGACTWYADHPAECVDCDSATGRFLRMTDEYYYVFDKLCVFECYQCGVGDIENEDIAEGEDTVCNKDPNDADLDAYSDSAVDYPEFHNYTRGDFCFYGFCVISVVKNKAGRIRAARGCSYNTSCTELEDSDEGENSNDVNSLSSQSVGDEGRLGRCRDTGAPDNEELCAGCCDGNLCNFYFYGGSTAVSASLTMIVLALSYVISLN